MEHEAVKFLRLKNGDDIVSEIVELEDENGLVYNLIAPLKVIYLPTNGNSFQIAFMPFIFSKICSNQEFQINSDDVLIISEVSNYTSTYYMDNVHLLTKDQEEPDHSIPQQEDEGEDLSELIQALANGRTYH